MTADQTAPEPKLTLSEALDRITAGEVKAIEFQLKTAFEKLSGTAMTSAVVWALERRKGKFTWADVDRMTMGELNGYFAPEPEDVPEELTESGKDGSELD